MEIKTLAATPLYGLTEAFNNTFADYFVSLHMTEELLATKIQSEHICLDDSVGVFANKKLVGFILHGIDTVNGTNTAYNAGTGVLPAYRGRRLTNEMYRFIVPRLKSKAICHHQLEVIEQNEKAIKAYERVGFSTVRTLGCFKGNVSSFNQHDLQFEETTNPDFAMFCSFWNFEPTWQNNTPAIERTLLQHRIVTVKKEGVFVGYAVWMPGTGRIKQFAVHPQYRRQGIGRSLLAHLCQKSATGTLSLINVDERDNATTAFLNAIGLHRFLGQLEMKYSCA